MKCVSGRQDDQIFATIPSSLRTNLVRSVSAIPLPKLLACCIASMAVLYLVLAPFNLPLYNLIMFPCPDPRTPNVEKKLDELRLYNAKFKEVAFRSNNGRLLHGWFFEIPNTQRVFLYSHGKGNNIFGKLHHVPFLLLCGGSVFMYDYQGYGKSQGRITIDGACDDATAAYDYLVKQEHRTGKDIIGFGESFGCGVTGQLSIRRKLAGVILQSGFSSLLRAGRDNLYWLNLYPEFVFPDCLKMDNAAIFGKPHSPLLIVHGKKDRILPFANAEDLYSAAVQPKSLYVVSDGGHCCFGTADQFVQTVKGFLAKNQI
jgi:uncharacterized protein